MSHGNLKTTTGSLPTVPTSFVTQNGTAVPAANILIVNGFDSNENNDNGIITKGGVAGTGTANEVDIVLTNRFRQATTTSGAVTSNVTILSALAAGTYVFDIKVLAYSSTSNSSNGYTLVGGVRSTGAATVLLSGQARDNFEEQATASADLAVVGNTVIVTVLGVAGIDYNWLVQGEYTYLGA